MADSDIQVGLGDGGFRLHDISMAVIGFGDNRFGLGFGTGAYFVHLPENIFENGFFAVVNRGDFLCVIRVSCRFDGIDGKHFGPDGTGSGHFQYIIGKICFCGIDLLLIIIVDLLYYILYGIARSAIFAGKEDSKAGTNKQPNQTDNDNHQYSDPTSGCDGRDQRLS